jgi:hypothetical protein
VSAGLADLVRLRCPTHVDRQAFGVATGLGYHALVVAAQAKPLPADEHLALCAALGVDPVTLASPAADMPPFGGAVLWISFGCALTIARHLKGHDQRATAEAARVSLVTVSRAEHGRPLSVASFVRLSSYAGLHPHVWTAAPRAHEAIAALGGDRAAAAADRDRFTGDTK